MRPTPKSGAARHRATLALCTAVIACACAGALAENPPVVPGPGAPAPDFTLTSAALDEVRLSTFAGKIVVLEWFNPDCPFVRYAHTLGPLKTMARDLAGDDLVWLAINSGGAGRQGHGAVVNSERREELGMTYPILLDEAGDVGRSYGARTTPQFVVIARDGRVAYRGALDSAPLGDLAGSESVNYVADAIASLRAGRPPRVPETRPYGCSVKYRK